jgi:hypothetical protein
MSKQQFLLQLQRVKCLDETGGSFAERFGNDEISLSCLGVDATGAAFKLDPFEVYAHFDDGDVMEFGPKTLLTLDVPDEGPFPKKCAAILILAEKGLNGGHQKVTQKAFEELDKMLVARKRELMGNGGNASDWGDVGEVVLDILFPWILGQIRSGIFDDVFDPKTVKLEIPSADFHWPDGTRLSPEFGTIFEGHSGKYVVDCYWEGRRA